MVRNKLAAAVLAISALQAGLASALGLGEINLNSALNQPLEAEIRLLDTGDLDPNQVVVRLASGADFERAGVSRDYFLTNLQFTVEMNGRGGGVIKVTTRDPVIEPYLNFLLEARWPNGRLMREYTVLLDLPTFSDTRAADPSPAGAGPAGPAGNDTAQPRGDRAASGSRSGPAEAAPRSARIRMPEASGEGRYRVQHNDTMSEIAARFRAGGASVEQTMLAIQQLNAGAFINGNINLVKSGYVLRLPTEEQARGIAQDQARAEIVSQTRAWRSGATGSGATGPQLDAREGGSSGAAGSQSEARLSIASSGDSERSAAGEGTGQGAGASTALRDELAASQESLDKSRRENDEMRSRLSDMERQIATLQRLIELKDDQLSALQSQLGAEVPAAETPDTVDMKGAAGDEPVDFNYAEAPVAKPPAAESAGNQAREKPGLLAQLTANWLYLGGLLLALVLALVAVLAARRRRAETETGDDEAIDEPLADSELALEDEGELLDLADDAFDDALTAEQQGESEPAAPSAMNVAATTAAAVAASQPVRAETGDALAEADIYIAYGRYQQAADLLQSAIRAEPERTDLRTKLLEVYVESRNKEAFQEQFLALAAMGDTEAVASVKEHLSSVDGVSGWLDDLPAGVAVAPAADASEQDDSDDDLVFADSEADDSDADDAFDFDLDLETLGSGSTLDLEDSGLGADGAAAVGGDAGPVDDDAAGTEPDFDGLALDLESIGGPEPGTPGAGSVLDTELPALDFASDDSLSLDQPGQAPASDTGLESLELDSGLQLEDSESALDLNLAGDDDFDLALASAESSPLSDLDLDLGSSLETNRDRDLGGEDTGLALDALEPAEDDLELVAGDTDSGIGDLDVAGDASDIGGSDEDLDFGTLGAELSDSESLDIESAESDALGLDSLSLDALDEGDAGLELGNLALDSGTAESPDTAAPGAAPSAGLGMDDPEDWTLESEPGLQAAADGVPEDLEPATDEAQALESALSGESFSAEAMDMEALDSEAGDADDDSFDFLGDADDIATRLDLARAYIDMGDADGAREILQEVVDEGDEAQKQEAEELMERL